MISLVQLLKETYEVDNLNLGDKYISANDISKKLEPNSEEIYDFGGGPFSPFTDKTIVIDAMDVPKNKNSNHKIHDLNQYIKLRPRNLINMSYSFHNFQDSSKIKDTINDTLKPNGYLVVQDYNNNLNLLKSMLKDYKILYEMVDEDKGFYVIVLQK